MQPDVSFIIAAFNAEASIERAVRSALDQNDVSVEVIVVDDRSSDRTVEIARSFRDVQVLALAQNRGPGGARNAALDAATGRWIAVLDSDDTVQPERLSRMIARAEREGAQIVVDNLDVVQENSGSRKTMFAKSFLKKQATIGLADFIRSNVIFKSTFNFGYMKPVFERAFIEKHGLRYDESLRIGEDYILFASALAKGARCTIDPAPGYTYHIREGSISRVLELRHVEAMLAADKAFEREHPLDGAAKKAFDERKRSLVEAASFLALVKHLKDRQPLKAIGAAIRNPVALRHLGMPIGARLRRLGLPFAQTRTE
jgi:succinoglycan biosynthesis protein ExoO